MCYISSWLLHTLTHWGRDKMDAIFQMTFSNAFSWMKMVEFRLTFHWSLFPRVKSTMFQHGSDNGLAPARRQAIIWTNDGWITGAYMRHSASSGVKWKGCGDTPLMPYQVISTVYWSSFRRFETPWRSCDVAIIVPCNIVLCIVCRECISFSYICFAFLCFHRREILSWSVV